ncbi:MULTISPECIES: hypothetical protein [unclassified Cupriavidus]|nr:MULTISPECIES: hypothetical protein [unclassified Cupriavidus]
MKAFFIRMVDDDDFQGKVVIRVSCAILGCSLILMVWGIYDIATR